MEPIVLRFTPDRDRLARAHFRWVVAPVRAILTTMVAMCAIFLMGVELLFGVTPSWIAALVLVACIGLLVFWWLESRRRGAIGTEKVTIDERGVARAWQGGSSALGWERFRHWLEDEDDFILVSKIDKARGVTLLPKSAMDDETAGELRALLNTMIDEDAEPIEAAFVEMDWDEEPPKR